MATLQNGNGPTLLAPDDDPRRWLEEADGEEALRWVSGQKSRTLKKVDMQHNTVQQELTLIYNNPSELLSIKRLGPKILNTWKNTQHPRGVLRYTTLESYQTSTPVWTTLLDFDKLAKDEGEDWVFQSVCIIPKTYDRAILSLARGGTNAKVLREFDLNTNLFVQDGFVTTCASKSTVDWYDRDTLLLCSAIGESKTTSSGYAKTVQIWKRGEDPVKAPIIFETTSGYCEAQFDDENKKVVFFEYTESAGRTMWIGNLTGPETKLDLPGDSKICWANGWAAIKIFTAWISNGEAYAAGTLLGIDLEALFKRLHVFTVLFTPRRYQTCKSMSWVNGKLVVSTIDHLVSSYKIFTPSADGWTTTPLILPYDTSMADILVESLDDDPRDSDGALIVTYQGPLTPPQQLLTSVTSAAPKTLKCAPAAFNAEGLEVTRHQVKSINGELIHYVQIGPKEQTGIAPVYMTGYGGFNLFVDPFLYREDIGKIWLERGGTSIIPIIHGDGEFGPEFHARRERKRSSCDDFAAVAADLVERGVTRPEKIAISGISNGGLLMLHMRDRYPTYTGAIFSGLPLADMRRYIELGVGSAFTGEYGDPQDPNDWNFMQKDSPYHTATADAPTRPILLMPSRNDDIAGPGHGRKMALKLQDLGHHNAYLYEVNSGHTMGQNTSDRAFIKALEDTFLKDCIGFALKYNEPEVCTVE